MKETETKNSTRRSKKEPVNDIVEKMYLEISSIAQGFVITLLITILAKLDWVKVFAERDFSTPIFAATSFIISVVFWTRYYFDTVILKRSFRTFSVIWFFGYFITEGISFTFIATPVLWLITTGFFLLFGFGFYVLNLAEIKRKQNIIKVSPAYRVWQAKRLIDLLVLALLTLSGGYIVALYPSMNTYVGIFALCVAVWQLTKTIDYRKYSFIQIGL